MSSTSVRRLPVRMTEPRQQNENAMPTPSCSAQLGASPSSIGRTALSHSPSKMPTLSDIAARLNRDSKTSTPAISSMKQLSSNILEATRPRLELTGRIMGSPKPPQHADRKSPSLPPRPSQNLQIEVKPDEQASVTLSPKAPSSGACSPTKRMLAKGLPSFEEIRERMSRKGLTAPSTESSPKNLSTPASPNKLAVQGLAKSSEIEVSAEPTQTLLHKPEAKISAVNGTDTANKIAHKVSTSPSIKVGLTHPLPPTPSKTPSHPLQHEWTLFFDTRSSTTPTPGSAQDFATPSFPRTPTLTTSSWEANLRTIGSYASVETFLGCFSKLHRPSQLDRHSTYHVFKDGIKPMWEDVRNARGGKWTVTFRQRNPALVDRSWLWLVLGLIGEEMDAGDETCGAVCSVRPRGDRILLWVRDRGEVEKVNRIGRKLVSLLELDKEPGVSVEFSSHSDRGGETQLEGVFSMNNPVQQIARSSTMPTTTNVTTVALGETISRSPMSVSPTAEAHTRLGGATNNDGMVGGRSPHASANVGLLGQSLGLGIVSTSPGVSPNGRTVFKQPSTEALSWRTNRTTSAQSLTLPPSPPKPIIRTTSAFKTD